MLYYFIYIAERPDAPEPPKVDRITKDSVTLSWNVPRNDGGSKIKGYMIQMKPAKGKNWEDVNTTPVNAFVYTVSNKTFI